VMDRDLALRLERSGIEEAQRRGAVAHDEMLAVVREPPPLGRILKGLQDAERVEVVHEREPALPRDLVELVAENRNAFAEVLAIDRVNLLDAAAREIHSPDRRCAVLAGPFV